MLVVLTTNMVVKGMISSSILNGKHLPNKYGQLIETYVLWLCAICLSPI